MSGLRWRSIKLKYLVALRSGDAIDGKDIKDEGDFPVYGGNGLRGYTGRFTHEGDRILIGRQGALCGNINYASGKFWATEHAIVATPRQDFNTTWLGEALRTLNLNQYAQSAAQPGIAVEVIENLEVMVPPRQDQDRIAGRLSASLANLDSLVEAKQALISLLTEKRRALIAHAATRGLNPDAPMRDSGIAWLGKSPEHWHTERARWLFSESCLPIEPGDRMVTCFRDGTVTLRSNRREDGFTNGVIEHGYQGIRKGQLVLHSMDAFAGAIGVSDSDGKCTPEYVICDPLTNDTDPHYFAALLREMALRRYVQAFCSAVRERAPRIRFNEFRDFVLPIPPLSEQRDIVDFIGRQAQPLLRLAEQTAKTLEMLKERRTALIAAAIQSSEETAHAT